MRPTPAELATDKKAIKMPKNLKSGKRKGKITIAIKRQLGVGDTFKETKLDLSVGRSSS